MSIVFHSWRTDGAECPVPRPAEPGPCQLVSPERLAVAETACSRLLGPPFSACHDHVEPGLVYNSCLDDVCACRGSLSNCFCPLLAAYADRCGAKVQTQYIFTQMLKTKKHTNKLNVVNESVKGGPFLKEVLQRENQGLKVYPVDRS